MLADNKLQHDERILIVFSDNSLGGTARSAQLAGAAWALAGFQVEFLALLGVHEERIESFANIGPIRSSVFEICWSDFVAVHYHHGMWTTRWRESAEEIIQSAIRAGIGIPLISHNVFGVPDSILDRWPGRRITNVLGHWSRNQLLGIQWPLSRRARVSVMPNPQDFEFFRTPSAQERQQAREDLGIRQEKLIVRVGSPHKGKWSRDYLELAKNLDHDVRMICVGVPDSYQRELSAMSNVEIHARTSSDRKLRDYYWAADVFALSADQGESFGNVILESTACGTPVVYRSRPFRDNTPWDFDQLPGFRIANSTEDWIHEVLELTNTKVDFSDGSWMRPFSLDGTSHQLVAQFNYLMGNGALEESSWRSREISTADAIRIFCRHNRIAFELIEVMRKIKGEVNRRFSHDNLRYLRRYRDRIM